MPDEVESMVVNEVQRNGDAAALPMTVPPARIASRAKDRAAELYEVVRDLGRRQLLIVVNGSPDPDCIASAWALRHISTYCDVETLIVYFKPVSHPENRALLKALDIEVRLWDDTLSLAEFGGYAVVDSQDTRFPVEDVLPRSCPLLIHVDHHRNLGGNEARFIDIRETAGSTSAMFAEYLQYGPVELSGGAPQDARLATALMHGIRTDTDDFFNARSIDYRAAEYLSRFADRDLLRIISTQLISAKAMDILQRSLERKEIYQNFVFSGVGYVRADDRDGIAQAADYLLRREGVDTVVVFGVVDETTIDGSLRTRSQSLDPDIFLKDILGMDAAGKHYGGGRQDKGGFQVPIGIFRAAADKKLVWDIVTETLRNLFLNKMGISHEEGDGIA